MPLEFVKMSSKSASGLKWPHRPSTLPQHVAGSFTVKLPATSLSWTTTTAPPPNVIVLPATVTPAGIADIPFLKILTTPCQDSMANAVVTEMPGRMG
jgi:hypothetical protein